MRSASKNIRYRSTAIATSALLAGGLLLTACGRSSHRP